MTLRPPDWERRLRDLERRADNRGTDIVRLWGRLPQAPELPGYVMPVIIPSSTAPPSTTTTTSTSSTTTSTTSTSTTSTTPPPLPCFPGFPEDVTIVVGSVAGSGCTRGYMAGTWILTPFTCNVTAGDFTIIYRGYVDASHFWDLSVYGSYSGTIAFDLMGFTGLFNNPRYLKNNTGAPANLAALKTYLLGRTESLPGSFPTPCVGPSTVPIQFSSVGY